MAGSLRTLPQGAAGYRGNLQRLLERLGKIPAAVREAVKAELNAAADELVQDMKAICPESPHFGGKPGDLKESIHAQEGRTELSVQVLADAKDEKGRYYGAHVEFGHRVHPTAHAILHGATLHVPPKPFFYPSLSRRRPNFSRRISRAARKAIASLS